MSVFFVWILFLILKLILASWIPFTPDESYYWVWTQNLALSYYDHPPMIAWLLKTSQWLHLPLWMDRWPVLILGHSTQLIWIYLLRQLRISPLMQILFLVFIGLHPIAGWGNLLAMPDALLLFFASLSYMLYLKALEFKKDWLYILFGLSLGFGFCAKYQIVLLVPPLLLAVFWFQPKELRLRGLLWTVVSGFIACLPVLIWNYQNDWISFRFQMNHGFGEEAWDPSWTINYFTSQLAIISPFVLYFAWKSFKRPNAPFLIRSSFLVGAFVLLFFFYSSTKNVVEANWPSLSYYFLFLLAFVSWSRRQALGHIVFWVILSSALIYFASIRPPKKWLEKASEPFIYRDIALEIQSYRPLYGGTYQLASVLWRTYQTPIEKLYRMSRYDQFDMWHEAKMSSPTPVNEKKFYILKFKDTLWPEWLEKQGFQANLIKSFTFELALYEVVLD